MKNSEVPFIDSSCDDVVYFDPIKNRIIIRRFDMYGIGGWKIFNYDGFRIWWNFKLNPGHWIFIDRLPEGTLWPTKRQEI